MACPTVIDDALPPHRGVSRNGEARFVIDTAERIVEWNGPCETLIGKPAREVLGKPCHEVMRGRDVYGNLYCHADCPIVHQVRDTEETVKPFELDVPAAGGRTRKLGVTTTSVRNGRGAVEALVHVLRPAAEGGNGKNRAPNPKGRRPLPIPPGGEASPSELTRREIEVLSCLGEGLTTDAVASRLGIGRVTVRNHVQRILRKLGAHSRLEAVAAAHRRWLA